MPRKTSFPYVQAANRDASLGDLSTNGDASDRRWGAPVATAAKRVSRTAVGLSGSGVWETRGRWQDESGAGSAAGWSSGYRVWAICSRFAQRLEHRGGERGCENAAQTGDFTSSAGSARCVLAVLAGRCCVARRVRRSRSYRVFSCPAPSGKAIFPLAW